MGRQAYMIGEDKTTISWMEESLRRHENEPENEKTVYLKDILKYYAFSSYNQGIILHWIYNVTFKCSCNIIPYKGMYLWHTV